MWSYCTVVKQIASRKSGACLGRWVHIVMITILLLAIPVVAAGPEGQEVCVCVCVEGCSYACTCGRQVAR